MKRPWSLRVGTARENTFGSRESAVAAAISTVYARSIGARAVVQHRVTGEAVFLEHLEAHRVMVRFHASKSELKHQANLDALRVGGE